MKTIKKNITITTITGVTVQVKNDELVQNDLNPVVIMGKTVTEKKAVKLLREHNNLEKEPVFVTDIHTEKSLFEMSVEEFAKYATKITE